jgi:hypothetical protein
MYILYIYVYDRKARMMHEDMKCRRALRSIKGKKLWVKRDKVRK